MRGFSLAELLIAMAMFLIVAGAGFSLFDQHVALATKQQSLSGLNIGMRNAMSQLEADLAGGGQNLLASVQGNVAPFSLGILVQNGVPGTAATCSPNTANWSYPIPSACFDSFTIINVKACAAAGGPYAPVLVIDDPGNAQESLSTSSIAWGNDFNAGASLTNDASCYNNGDELLVIQFPSSGTTQVQCDNNQFNYCMAVVTLTKDAQVSGGKIELQHNPTGASSDPLGIVFNSAGGTNFTKANALGIGYSNGAYIIDLGNGSNDITYAVQANPANSSDAELMRCAGTSCTGTNGQAVTNQVIGFKVGAALWDNAQTGATDIANYFYNSANYCSGAVGGADCSTSPPPANDPNDFASIRSIRISMVGRTSPNSDLKLATFKNGFDNGPYLVQQASVVVDLRNMSINEFGN